MGTFLSSGTYQRLMKLGAPGAVSLLPASVPTPKRQNIGYRAGNVAVGVLNAAFDPSEERDDHGRWSGGGSKVRVFGQDLAQPQLQKLAEMIQDHYWGRKFRMPSDQNLKQAATVAGVLQGDFGKYTVAPTDMNPLGGEHLADSLPANVIWTIVKDAMPQTEESVGAGWLRHSKLWDKLGYYNPGQRGYSSRDENGMYRVLARLAQYNYIWFNQAGSVVELRVRPTKDRINAGGPGSGRRLGPISPEDLDYTLGKYGFDHVGEHNGVRQYRQLGGHTVHVNPHGRFTLVRKNESNVHGHSLDELKTHLKREEGIAAGGPGSGCRGPNCGRPAKGHAIDVSQIPRNTEYPLNQVQRDVETRFREQLAKDPQHWIRQYRKQYGNELNADNAKELSSDFQRDRATNSPAVHEPASWLIKQMYQKELATTRPNKSNVVFFTAGGAGAGKTSALKYASPEAKGMMKQAQVVYDGTLRPASSAKTKVDQAMKAGKDVAVMYVHADPEQAFRQMLGRADRQEKDLGSGRTVPLHDFAMQHSSIKQSMQELSQMYKGNPRFNFGVMDNSGAKGQTKQTTLEALPKSPTYDELVPRLSRILEDEHNAGRISDRIYHGVGASGGRKEVGL